MQIYLDADLKPYHTFAIETYCDVLVIVETIDELKQVYLTPEWKHLPKIVLGRGSNTLFTQHFRGVVILNRIAGKSVVETNSAWQLHVSAGEDWPELVAWSVENGFYGMENLALIPGCAGSAPIQNIGAYGVEFKDICDYVDLLCLETLQVKRLTAHACQFGYRDSIFKHQLRDKGVIVAIGLKLSKVWKPQVNYGALHHFFAENKCSAADIYQQICHIRRSKLPDPTVIGNAGSFFKNPIISQIHFEKLQAQYPDIVAYPTETELAKGEASTDSLLEKKVKVAAGWLIERCGLKGTAIGGAKVHQQQALVLINYNGLAIARDVIQLAAKVYNDVFEQYQIELEHEVRFIGEKDEVTLKQCL